MRTRPPEWFDEWVKLRTALNALSRALQTDDADREAVWLRACADAVGAPTKTSVEAIAAAITEALSDLRDSQGPPKSGDLAEQAIEIWYQRVVEGRSTRAVADRLGLTKNKLDTRCGSERSAVDTWDGIARISSTVRAAIADEIKDGVPHDVAHVRYVLARLGERERTAAAIVSLLTPDIDVAEPLSELGTVWHQSYPPIREVFEQPHAVGRALETLETRGLLARGSRGETPRPLVMRAATAAAIRRALPTVLLEDAADQLVTMIASLLDDEAVDPNGWAPWRPFVPHVEMLCEAAVRFDTALRDASTLLNGLGQFWRFNDNPAEALRVGRRAVAVGRKAFGRSHRDVAPLLVNVGEALSYLGRHLDGLKPYDEAVALLEAYNPDGRKLANVLAMRANVRRSAGSAVAAIADLERAREILRPIPDADVERFEVDAAVADILADDGRVDEAVTIYERLWNESGDDFPGAEARQNAADALLNAERALIMLEAARRGLEERYPRATWRRWRLHVGLAEAHERLGNHDAAHKYRRESVAINDEFIEGETGE